MHFPLEINFLGDKLSVHLIFDLLSFFIAYRYFLVIKKQRGTPIPSDQHEWFIFVGMAIGALVGSRLLAALEHPQLFFAPPAWQYYFVSKTIVGGILGGIIGVEIAKRIHKIKRSTGNLFVYPLILAIAIGRVGCFLTGVSDGTAGLPSHLPWAFDQGDGIARHPTALYEILFLMIIWAALRFYEKHKQVIDGELFQIFVFSYCAFRLLIEFIKPREPLAFGLSSIQLAVLIAMIYFGRKLLLVARQRSLAPQNSYGTTTNH